jgi:hypothetical protein
MSDTAHVEDEIAEHVTAAYPTSIGDVVRLAKNSEDQDVAYIMAYQLNVMYEANIRFRGKAALLTEDVQMMMRMADYMLRQRQARPMPRRAVG